ncbi:DUF3383 family protein [Priestia megaterium]|uniref:DUF3383 family protein n=1 Tax=Priestia megaterium TaxID=1404 RepID=UPI002FFD9458
MALQDVIVTIDLVKPSGLVGGLGKPLIVTQKTGESTYKTYSDISDVSPDFATTTEAYKKAAAIFAQTNRPATLAIATYDPAGTEVTTAAAAVEKYYEGDWFFVVTAGLELTDEIAVADYVEGKSFKFYSVKTVDVESRNAFKTKNYKRVIDFYHPTPGEHPDAALVGELGSQQVGENTWKFKTLTGITPIDINAAELESIHEDGAIAYVTKTGVGQTSEGFTVSGEFIDLLHGQAWVKANMESSIQGILMNNKRVTMDSRGIALLDSAATTVLQQAFNQGIIAADVEGNPVYTVSMLSADEIPDDERAQRIYNGLSFSYQQSGGIHSANVKGQILV